MTHELSDAECAAIWEAAKTATPMPVTSIVFVAIRAAYAAGRASVPREIWRAMHDAATGVTK